MNIKPYIILVAYIVIFSNTLYAKDSICPVSKPDSGRAEELKMFEHEFTKQHYLSSLDFVRNEFPRRVLSYKTTNEYIHSSDYWRNYYNSLTFIEGYVLKQAAINEVESRNPADKAVKEFCAFLKDATYVD